MSQVCVHLMYAHLGVHTSDVRTPQRFTVLHHICSTIFPLILGVKVLHINLRIMEYVVCQDIVQDWYISAGLVHSINMAVWIFPQCTLRNSIGSYFSFGN